MEKAKIFMNGGSQAVRLPKGYRFEGDEVIIRKVGSAVMLMPANDRWESMMKGLNGLTEDFLKDPIEELPLEEREEI